MTLHTKLSYIKSAARIVGYIALLWDVAIGVKYGIAMTVLSPDPDYQPTWEQASISVTHDEDGVTYFYIADPNGKKIEISKAELDALPRGIS